jgi:hypothetical protein
MRTIITIDGFIETSSLGCGEQKSMTMQIAKSPFYANRLILQIGEGEAFYVDLDYLSNAVAMFAFEKELLSADS